MKRLYKYKAIHRSCRAVAGTVPAFAITAVMAIAARGTMRFYVTAIIRAVIRWYFFRTYLPVVIATGQY